MRIRIALISVFMLMSCNAGVAQIGLGGFDEIMTVPTARILPDGHIAFGFGYIPKPYSVFLASEFDNLPYFTTLGFLPFLEISFRATKALGRSEGSIGDRMASVRLQLSREKSFLPALTVGLHDISAIMRNREWFHALYAVATKSISLPIHISVETTIGYGVDWIDARIHQLNGLFGGVSLGYRNRLFIKGEYDTNRLNYGCGLSLLDFFTANLVMLDGKKIGFGLNLKRPL